ncbi:MAG: phosphoribosylanthranilate isomerase [Sedimentisphaerales bacterium]|nr:phosphoribosylanthranilate isomerase [Sedimentisphaerales bacterium]
MLITKVKICGITNYDDAVAAMDMGADLLGFNFYKKSPRYISPEKVAEIVDQLPSFIDLVGVFVNSPIEEIHETIQTCSLNWVQLHGDEDLEFCNSLRSHDVKTMKAIRVKNQSDIESTKDFFTDAILLDAFDPDKYGGTGVTFDWNIIGHIGKRVFLAGGINPDNAEAALKLGVYGIDVCSGIETSPGIKDHNKMKQLFDNIRYLRG